MYRQPSRWERRIAEIEAASQKGKFGVWLYLYSNEYRKLKRKGFTLSDPIVPYNKSQKIWVSWEKLNATLYAQNEPIFHYCYLMSDSFPETDYFADTCFLKAVRFNLEHCPEREVGFALLGMLDNCAF